VIENGSKRVNVAEWADGATLEGNLLGGKERRCPERLAGDGGTGCGIGRLRQAKICYPRSVVGTDQDVARLEITMQHTLAVGIVHRLRHCFHVAHGLGWGQRLRPHQPPKIRAGDVFHRVIRLALVFSHLEDGYDPRVLQTCGCLGFLSKALLKALTRVSAAQQEFERHDPIQASLPRPIDDPHAPVGDEVQQFVIADIGDKLARGREVLE